jgi:hypothetical protein
MDQWRSRLLVKSLKWAYWLVPLKRLLMESRDTPAFLIYVIPYPALSPAKSPALKWGMSTEFAVGLSLCIWWLVVLTEIHSLLMKNLIYRLATSKNRSNFIYFCYKTKTKQPAKNIARVPSPLRFFKVHLNTVFSQFTRDFFLFYLGHRGWSKETLSCWDYQIKLITTWSIFDYTWPTDLH